MSIELSTPLVVEILATLANLIFIVLLIREKILCWPFGIVGSVLSIYLFAGAQLYSEAVLYSFYAGMGCWGWLRWHRRALTDSNPVISWQHTLHWWAILGACIAALALGYSMQTFSDAQRPLFDAFTTSFSFLATYMEVTKVLQAWLYWLVINVASVWLYHDRALDIYAVLIGFYSIMSVWGFVSWRRAYRAQSVSV